MAASAAHLSDGGTISDSGSEDGEIRQHSDDGFPDVLELETPLGGAKRRRDSAASAGSSRRQSSGDAGGGSGGTVPWRGSGQHAFVSLPKHSALLRLHEEILEFVSMMRPTAGEEGSANTTLERIVRLIQGEFPGALVTVFGSRATGLALPDADWDLCVQNVPNTQTNLYRLGHAIETAGFGTQVQVIASARVPIVKYIDAHSAINVDISLDQDTGADSTQFARLAAVEWPLLRPLMLVLKYYLKQRGLAETYTGGIGSFLLTCMVLRSLQVLRDQVGQAQNALTEGMLHGGRKKSASTSATAAAQGTHSKHWAKRLAEGSKMPLTSALNLGAALVNFLELYGIKLNYVEVGMSVRGAGAFFKKRSSRLWNTKTKFDGLCMESPVDPEHDVGGGAWNTFRYKSAFQSSLLQLQSAIESYSSDPVGSRHGHTPKRARRSGRAGSSAGASLGTISSLLACVIPPDSYLRARCDMLLTIPPKQRYAYSDADAAAGGRDLSGAAGAVAPLPVCPWLVQRELPGGTYLVVELPSDTETTTHTAPAAVPHHAVALNSDGGSSDSGGSDGQSDSDGDSAGAGADDATDVDGSDEEADGAAGAAGTGAGDDEDAGYDTSEEAAPAAVSGRSLRRPRLLHHILIQKHCRPEAQEAAMNLNSWF